MSQTETFTEASEMEGPMPIQDYRAYSALAIVSLVLGLLSFVAIFAPILGFFAVVAIAFGGYTLWHIHNHSERLSGRWMAVTALMLAPLFLGWGFAREISRRELFVSQARKFADDFLSLLNRNEPYFAHQLMVEKKHRLDLHTNFQVAYQANETASTEFQRTIGGSPTKEILAASPNVTFQFEEHLNHKHIGIKDEVTLLYAYRTPGMEKVRFWVRVKRDYSNYTGTVDWQVLGITNVRPSGA